MATLFEKLKPVPQDGNRRRSLPPTARGSIVFLFFSFFLFLFQMKIHFSGSVVFRRNVPADARGLHLKTYLEIFVVFAKYLTFLSAKVM